MSTVTEAAQVIAGKLSAGASNKQVAQQVAEFLVATRQTSLLAKIMRRVMTIRQTSGIIEANVTTAYPLTPALLSQVKSQLRIQYPDAKNFIVTQTVDRSVLSGIRIKTNDMHFDDTAQEKLNKLKSGALYLKGQKNG